MLALAMLAIVALGCADDTQLQGPPPEWSCELIGHDASRRAFVGKMPQALRANEAAQAVGVPVEEVQAVECIWYIEARFYQSLVQPAAALAALGRSPAGDLSASFDGLPLAGAGGRAGSVLPVALRPSSGQHGRHELRVRLGAGVGHRTLASGPGMWSVGELRAVHLGLMRHFVPDLAAAALMLMLSLTCALAAVLLRRTAPSHLPALGWLSLAGASFAFVRLTDNALLPFSARWPALTTARLLVGTWIVLTIVEALRSQIGMNRSRWFWPLYGGTALGIVGRALSLAGVGPVRLLNVADVVATAGFGYVVALGVVALVRKPPGYALIASATFLILPLFFSRMAWVLLQRALPDMSVWAIVGVVMTLVVVVARNVSVEQARLMRGKLVSRYVPSQLVKRVLDGEPPVRGRVSLTVFFSDLPELGSVARSLGPEVLGHMLSEYLTRMVEIAERHGGTVDKLIGDVVMVFFGAPEPIAEKDGALACVRMAEDMHAALELLARGWQGLGARQALSARMGIHTGPAVVGDLGSAQRADYTVVGSTVNLASRLKGRCPQGKIVLSDATWALIRGEVAAEPLGSFTPKGYQRAFDVYAVDPARGRATAP